MSERLVICVRRVGADWESEPVVIEPFGGKGVTLHLDDGDELIFDRAELTEALSAQEVKAA